MEMDLEQEDFLLVRLERKIYTVDIYIQNFIMFIVYSGIRRIFIDKRRTARTVNNE